jgi:hypothetical protein
MKMTKVDEKMREALADYIGPVTRYPPGHARAPAKKAPVTNGAAFEWLKRHRADKPTKDVKAERSCCARARLRRLRIARRNAAVLKRLGK